MSAAVFLGVPATTLDLDIVHSRTTNNIERLQKLLASIDSFYRRPKDKIALPLLLATPRGD